MPSFSCKALLNNNLYLHIVVVYVLPCKRKNADSSLILRRKTSLKKHPLSHRGKFFQRCLCPVISSSLVYFYFFSVDDFVVLIYPPINKEEMEKNVNNISIIYN